MRLEEKFISQQEAPHVDSISDTRLTPDGKGDDSHNQLAALRSERDRLALRQQQLAELLGCPPEKVEHEIRNVLNELRLLRSLFQSQEKT